MNSLQQIDLTQSVRHTGAVYTPEKVASSLAQKVMSLAQAKSKLRVLEPSVGDGAFISALKPFLNNIDEVVACDIDDLVVQKLRSEGNSKCEFITCDFIHYASEKISHNKEKFDLVIGNPPFIKKSNFNQEFKKNLSEFCNLTEHSEKLLKNAWAAFLMASDELLNENGTIAMVLPYEILTVIYGQEILLQLNNKFSRIDLYVSDERAFKLIDQDAVILIAQKQTDQKQGLFIHKLKSLENINVTDQPRKIIIQNESHISVALSSFLIPQKTTKLINTLYKNSLKISDHVKTAPGIVTAANEFFIISKQQAIDNKLEQFTLPILKRGSFANNNVIFTKQDFKKLEQKNDCHLLSIKGAYCDLDADVKKYIQQGEELNYHSRYKCRNRNHWYDVPLVPTASGFVFKRCHEMPKLLINQAEIYTTDTAYGIYPNKGFNIQGITYSFYNSLTLLFAEIRGRFYGGGVLELSPMEFRSLPLVYHEPNKQEMNSFLKVFKDSEGNPTKVLDYGDNWMKDKLSLSNTEVASIRDAWVSVRNHRLRHSSRTVSV